MGTVNHSMHNGVYCQIAAQAPDGAWYELELRPGDTTMRILLFPTYCPGGLWAFSAYFGFDFPYLMPIQQIFLEPPLWIEGNLAGNGLINEEQAVILDPTVTPARGRTLTNQLEVYGWYTKIQPLNRDIRLNGNSLNCNLSLQWLASAATVRVPTRGITADDVAQLAVLIPEASYTQAIQDADDWIYAADFFARVVGIYRAN